MAESAQVAAPRTKLTRAPSLKPSVARYAAIEARSAFLASYAEMLNRRAAPPSPTRNPGAPVQLKITPTKRYPSREALTNALYAAFDADARPLIDKYVEGAVGAEWSITANMVFDQIVDLLAAKEIKPTHAVATVGSTSRHGPQLPTRASRTDRDDPKAAMSSFTFSSVTLARAVLSDGRVQINFHDRQVDANFHAEDGIIHQLEGYIERKGLGTRGWRLNLTINNFFCSPGSTKKGKGHQSCLLEIIALQRKYRFERFHVYFKNTYGTAETMETAIRSLRKAGILVTAFGLKDEKAYSNPLLDPASDSEEEVGDGGRRSRLRSARGGGRRRGDPNNNNSAAAAEESDEEEGRSRSRSRSYGRPAKEKGEGKRKRSRSRSASPRGREKGRRGLGKLHIPQDVVRVGGHRYAPNVGGIRDLGQCFWDTLRSRGVKRNAIAQAAQEAHLEVNQHVNVQEVTTFMGRLNQIAGLGTTYRVVLVPIDLLTLKPGGPVQMGDGAVPLHIGLFHQGDEGHYVPALD